MNDDDVGEGTDAARIAECLGLDASHFRQALRRAEDDDAAVIAVTEESEAEKYRDCEDLKIPCRGCGADVAVTVEEDGSSGQLTLQSCPACKLAPLDDAAYVRNRVARTIRQHVRSYYEAWSVCEDPACALRTRQTPLTMIRGQPVCPACRRGILHPEFSERFMYRQLGYYQHVLSKDSAGESRPRAVHPDLLKLKSDINKIVSSSAYSEVNLNKLFEGLFPQKMSQ